MNCQRCLSKRIFSISGKCSDLCNYSLNGKEPSGNYHYVPEDMNVGGGDFLTVDVCLDCGQMQGSWPLPKSKFESELELREKDPFKNGDHVEFKHCDQLITGYVKSYNRDTLEVTICIDDTNCLTIIDECNVTKI